MFHFKILKVTQVINSMSHAI